MPTVEKENLHKEHRRRVKERYLKSGLDSFSPHELLELILFYAIPQKDTNELGHRLLAHFGSLNRVFSASVEELCEVDGISEHSAILLHLWLPAAAYVQNDRKTEQAPRYNNVARVGRFLVRQFEGVRRETVMLMLLDNGYRLLDCVRVHEGSVNSVGITPRCLIEQAFRRNAAMAVLAHNHPVGIAIPSPEDIGTTVALRDAFRSVGISLVEHILVAGDSYTPIMMRSQELLAEKISQNAFYAVDSLEDELEE